jgi:hypothetical protein
VLGVTQNVTHDQNRPLVPTSQSRVKALNLILKLWCPGADSPSELNQSLSEKWDTRSSHMIIMLSGASVPPMVIRADLLMSASLPKADTFTAETNVR